MVNYLKYSNYNNLYSKRKLKRNTHYIKKLRHNGNYVHSTIIAKNLYSLRYTLNLSKKVSGTLSFDQFFFISLSGLKKKNHLNEYKLINFIRNKWCTRHYEKQKWFYFYTTYSSNFKFKYLYSYNYLDYFSFNNYNWYLRKDNISIYKKKLLNFNINNFLYSLNISDYIYKRTLETQSNNDLYSLSLSPLYQYNLGNNNITFTYTSDKKTKYGNNLLYCKFNIWKDKVYFPLQNCKPKINMKTIFLTYCFYVFYPFNKGKLNFKKYQNFYLFNTLLILFSNLYYFYHKYYNKGVIENKIK